jgi:hypothetical protein
LLRFDKPSPEFCSGNFRVVLFVDRPFCNTVVLVTRIVGYSLLAKRLYAGGPNVEELLLPCASPEDAEHLDARAR